MPHAIVLVKCSCSASIKYDFFINNGQVEFNCQHFKMTIEKELSSSTFKIDIVCLKCGGKINESMNSFLYTRKKEKIKKIDCCGSAILIHVDFDMDN